jgi:hypothetical protein
VDWDSRLAPHLDDARRPSTREAQASALRRLVADVRDGHGHVTDPRGSPRSRLPIQFGLVEGQVVTESVMGYVSDRKLGTIVGATTAGANGNVAMFSVPGGFSITFTGMRVTGHDGRTPHHLAGVAPDVAVEPTIAGLRAGRDEVLERAMAAVRER